MYPGKRPEEFPNTWNVPEEREYYERVYRKIETRRTGQDSVTFDGWVEITEFLRKIRICAFSERCKVSGELPCNATWKECASGAVTAALQLGRDRIYLSGRGCDGYSLEDMAEYIGRLTNRSGGSTQRAAAQRAGGSSARITISPWYGSRSDSCWSWEEIMKNFVIKLVKDNPVLYQGRQERCTAHFSRQNRRYTATTTTGVVYQISDPV